MKFYDLDGDGSITYDEFLSGLRDPLNERRLNMVKKAFAMLDRSGNGEITTSEIAGIYDVSQNPEFLEGRKTKDEILAEFLNNFDGPRGNNDGTVTWNEFQDYYSNVSASIDDDAYFELMIKQAWNLDNRRYGKAWGAEF